MLHGLLVTFFIIIAFLLSLLVLIQQSKGNMGLGAIGGGAQMLFGGSGGQDIFQKTTWVLGALFMVLSLFLSINRAHSLEHSGYIKRNATAVATTPAAPAAEDY